MASSVPEKPVVATLHAPEEGPPPGLGAIEDEADLRYASDYDSLAAALEEADVLLVTDFRTQILREAWSRGRRLQWVHATSAGVDALMFPALVDSDVPITNARGIFDDAIAEFVLGLILIFAKDFAASFALQRQHKWRHRDTETVAGRTVLVVGAGSIGRCIARQVTAAGMRAVGLARRPRENDPDFAEVHAADDLHELLPRADYVVIAAPLTEATRGLFGAREFRLMQAGARLINIGRGPIVRTDALVDALRAGEIAGAGLDVFEQEPLPVEHPLWDMPQVVMSAHMAGDFLGWREALTEQFIDNFRRWREGRPLENLVDKGRGYVPQQAGSPAGS